MQTHRTMRLTNGKVGIGTSSPEGTLHIEAGSSGSSYSPDGADKLILENNSSVLFDIRSPASDQGLIAFSDTTRAVGLIGYNHSENSLRFSTNSSERIRIDSSAGKVFVATTTEASDDVGHALLANGAAYHTTDGTYGRSI